MKSKYIMLSMLFVSMSLFSFARTSSDTIKVWGNCEMCKGKIEKAAKEAGAASAEWNKETKVLVVSYDESKTSNMAIQKKIAAAGYDTQDVKATDGSYKKLDKCCQYKRADSSTKGMDDMKDMKGMNDMKNMKAACCKDEASCGTDAKCSKDMECCKSKDAGCESCKDTGCCKSALGKGYNYIGSSCVIASASVKADDSMNHRMSCCM